MMLSDRNRQAIALYRRAKAGCLTDDERQDPIVQETISLCSRIDDEYERFLIESSTAKMMLDTLGMYGHKKAK